MNRTQATLLLALSMAIVATPALAQTLYKLIDKDGKVTYVETPPKNFDGKVIRLEVDPNANRMNAPKAPAAAPGAAEAGAKLDASRADRLRAARAKLEAARRQFDSARENPAEGETRVIQNAKGRGARVVPSEDGQARLIALERAVQEAEAEVRALESGR